MFKKKKMHKSRWARCYKKPTTPILGAFLDPTYYTFKIENRTNNPLVVTLFSKKNNNDFWVVNKQETFTLPRYETKLLEGIPLYDPLIRIWRNPIYSKRDPSVIEKADITILLRLCQKGANLGNKREIWDFYLFDQEASLHRERIQNGITFSQDPSQRRLDRFEGCLLKFFDGYTYDDNQIASEFFSYLQK